MSYDNQYSGRNTPYTSYTTYPGSHLSQYPSLYSSYPSYSQYSSQLRRRRKQRYFTKDIEDLLYALGDGPYPSEETANALDDTLTEYLGDLCYATQQYARAHGRNRVKMDDFPFALRNDPLKEARFEHIIKQKQKIERDRKMYDHDTYVKEMENAEKKKRGPKKRGRKPKKQVENDDEDDDEEENDD